MAKLNLNRNVNQRMSVKEKRHICIMLIALIMLGSIVIRPLFMKSPEPVERRERDIRNSDKQLEPDFPVVEAQTRQKLLSPQEKAEGTPVKETRSYTPGQVLGDPETWKATDTGETASPEAFNRAVELVCDLSEEELAQAASEKKFQTIDANDYPAQRGRVFTVKGSFAEGPQLAQVSLNKTVVRKLPFVAKMYRGIMKTGQGDMKIVCMGTRVFEGYILDRPVYFHGIFTGMERVPAGDSAELLPLFVYRHLHLVEGNPLADIEEFRPGMRLGMKKIWDLADDRLYDVIERDPYYHAIQILVHISQENLEACIDPELMYADMIRLKNNPSRHRGKVYRLKGRLLRIEEKEVDRNREICKKMDNFPIIFVGQILENKSKKPFTFRALDIPRDLVEGDYVDMVGIFVKRYTYQNRKGENWYTKTPLIMGKRMTKFERVYHLVPIVGGIGIVVLVLVVAAALYERKKYREYKQRMKESKERKRKKMQTPSHPEEKKEE